MTRFRAPDRAALLSDGAVLLAALRARPGFRTGEFGVAVDDEGLCALLTTWDGVGAYRRALSAPEVKIAGAPVWLHAVDEPGVYLAE
ncbi:antibiotic biosynthesis monooxygenase [Klenkia sp. LSe6-5]|uniref:Antibiotic biosynthesis monooxygenase n=1 Tax=Klenkia sesuvii TaxID=3103137 RepID=A0ABU8DSD9_9ACTN